MTARPLLVGEVIKAGEMGFAGVELSSRFDENGGEWTQELPKRVAGNNTQYCVPTNDEGKRKKKLILHFFVKLLIVSIANFNTSIIEPVVFLSLVSTTASA